MTLKITVDRAACDGFGNCVNAAQDVFDIDDTGLVVLKQERVGNAYADRLKRAVYDCPANAIKFAEE